MLISDELQRCTVFVYYENRKGERRPAGTAFMVAKPIAGTKYEWNHFVTARHVVELARAATDLDGLFVRVNLDDGTAGFVFIAFEAWIGHPSDTDSVGADWLAKSVEARYDVAVAACAPGIVRLSSTRLWPYDSFVTPELSSEQAIQPGDELAITGLYRNHVGSHRNIPIVRSGTIAALPDEPIATRLGPMEAYLVETRSIGGLSGSPVFWISGMERIVNKEIRLLPQHLIRLLGMVHGHFDALESDLIASAAWPVPERLNEGMSVVVPVEHILQTLTQEAIVSKQRPIEAALQAETQDSAASLDAVAGDSERVSLAPLDPETALRALLDTPKPDEKD